MASKKKPTAALLKYVHQVARTNIRAGRPGVEVREHGDLIVSYFEGKAFSSYQLVEDEIVFRFRRPHDDSVRKAVAEHYTELTSPKDWLEYRRPLSKDPKPNLQARLAEVAGGAFFAIREGHLKLVPVDASEILEAQ
jgi:hypothetical protein